MVAPAWMKKHPCTTCQTGYGMCAQWHTRNLKCCKSCDHPGRWVKKPYTASETREMWKVKEMPEHVKLILAGLELEEEEAKHERTT